MKATQGQGPVEIVVQGTDGAQGVIQNIGGQRPLEIRVQNSEGAQGVIQGIGGQRPLEIIVQGSDGAQGIIQTPMAGGMEVNNPATIIINTNEIKINDEKQEQNNPLRKRRFRPKSGYRYWLRRIFVGKDEKDVKRERELHPWIHFLKGEVGRHTAEFIGTFFLVFFIAGIQINQDRNTKNQIANVDKGLVAGFILCGLIFCFGHVSGAHFNPCVTLGFFLRGAFSIYDTITYIIVQFIGAVCAAAVLYGLFGNIGPGLGTTTPRWSLQDSHSFGIEILITFILITVILTTAQNVQLIGSTSGIAVGTTFGALELFAWNFTGGSANPWRTIGPTMISGVGWGTYWIYIVGPLVGTLLAVVGQRIMVNGISHFDSAEGKGHNRNSANED